jgi:hypothetical protein
VLRDGPPGHAYCIKLDSNTGTWWNLDSELPAPVPLCTVEQWGAVQGRVCVAIQGDPRDYNCMPRDLLPPQDCTPPVHAQADVATAPILPATRWVFTNCQQQHAARKRAHIGAYGPADDSPTPTTHGRAHSAELKERSTVQPPGPTSAAPQVPTEMRKAYTSAGKKNTTARRAAVQKSIRDFFVRPPTGDGCKEMEVDQQDSRALDERSWE